jgi:hypothetical protein
VKIERKVVSDMGPEYTVAHINFEGTYKGVYAQKGKTLSVDFEVRTYKDLMLASGPEPWKYIFEHVNGMFKMFSKEDQVKIYEFYIKCRMIINKLTFERVQESILEIANETKILIYDIRLPEVAYDYVLNHSKIKLPNKLKSVGHRPHDVPELTFREPEYWKLTVLGIICKMFAPIWGAFARKGGPIVKNKNKEFYCYLSFRPILEHDIFMDIHEKLSGYIENNIDGCLKKSRAMKNRSSFDVDFSLINKGFGKDRFRDYVYATVLVKKIVTYNPTTPESDIMKFLYVNINYSSNQMITGKAPSNTVTVMVRRSVIDSNDGDEDSVTALENESRISKVPADTPIYAKLCVTYAITRLLKEYKISKRLFDNVRGYYYKNLIKLSPFSKTIITTMFGKEIGGAKTVEYLTILPATDLIALAQIRMCQYADPQLIHMLTSDFPDEDKDEVYSSIDGRIRILYPESTEFKACLSTFPHMLGSHLNITEQIKSCANFVTDYHHFYNTAPDICDLIGMDEPVSRQDRVVYDEYVVNQLCEFILFQSECQLNHVA